MPRNAMNESKKWVSVGCLCLAIGLGLPFLFHPATQVGKDVTHGLSGMLLGMSICFNFRAVWLKRRRPACQDDENERSAIG